MNKISVLKTFLLFLIVFFASNQELPGQKIKKTNFIYGFGVGYSRSMVGEGPGIAFSGGYQMEIWSERLRFTPNIGIGAYMDWYDNFIFASVNLELTAFYDLIRIKPFSLTIGTGALINNSTRTYLKLHTDIDSNKNKPENFHAGVILSSGLRIVLPKEGFNLEILPLYIRFGTNYFAEAHILLRVDLIKN